MSRKILSYRTVATIIFVMIFLKKHRIVELDDNTPPPPRLIGDTSTLRTMLATIVFEEPT